VRLTKSAYRSNWELSVSRSNSVIEQLVLNEVTPERLVAAATASIAP